MHNGQCSECYIILIKNVSAIAGQLVSGRWQIKNELKLKISAKLTGDDDKGEKKILQDFMIALIQEYLNYPRFCSTYVNPNFIRSLIPKNKVPEYTLRHQPAENST